MEITVTQLSNNCKILVPVDFSEFSRKAFRVAEEFAKLFNSKITPFHAYDLFTHLDTSHYLDDLFRLGGDVNRIEQRLRDHLEAFAAECVDKALLLPGHLLVGNAAQSIASVADQFDLVVMGSHGKTGFSRLFLGSVAEKTLRLVNRPVVIVKDETDFAPIKKILVTTDFSEDSYAAFPYARAIALAARAEIHLFNAICSDFESPTQFQSILEKRSAKLKELAEQRLPNLTSPAKTFVMKGEKSAHNAIHRQVEQHQYNLVVMTGAGHTGLEYLRLGSTAASLVREVKSVVMVIKPR